jgi:hypothetical protein
MVSEHENTEDRGHLPAHEVRKVVETSLCLLENKQREGRHRFVTFNLGFLPNLSYVNIAADCYMNLVSNHMLSHDKVLHPYVTCNLTTIHKILILPYDRLLA